MEIRNILTNLHINPKNIAKSTVNAGKDVIRFDKITPEMASNNVKAYGMMFETQDMSAITAKDGKLFLSNMDNGNIEKEIVKNNPYESYTVVYDKNGKLTQLREQVANKPEVIVE